ncbi:hypothetical protein CH25_gp12 [Mycobacterium phage EagleEye]|uniref:Uncharacterized protein n=1 Tax=Mycobacterium phage EagleEye TaxID=1429759 RepID=W0LMU9_9CAUD|nr:hypothetical protein CH25_gp12 [Mycobacterium phage EagleEye]AHG23874.1 hypothetical protein PBI_EAGLEEYE_94 [Mycobacterium phage EagleEye]
MRQAMDTFEFTDKYGDTVRFTRFGGSFGYEVTVIGPRGGVKSSSLMDGAQADALRWFLVDKNKEA